MSTTKALIKELRARGLSQSEIARRTGIPQPRISRWESGFVPTGSDDALKLFVLAERLRSDDPPAELSGAEVAPQLQPSRL